MGLEVAARARAGLAEAAERVQGRICGRPAADRAAVVVHVVVLEHPLEVGPAWVVMAGPAPEVVGSGLAAGSVLEVAGQVLEVGRAQVPGLA